MPNKSIEMIDLPNKEVKFSKKKYTQDEVLLIIEYVSAEYNNIDYTNNIDQIIITNKLKINKKRRLYNQLCKLSKIINKANVDEDKIEVEDEVPGQYTKNEILLIIEYISGVYSVYDILNKKNINVPSDSKILKYIINIESERLLKKISD
jgi:hypothetical protein